MQKLKDRVAIITGGAQGIGAAYARAMAAEGARVAIADILDGTSLAKEIEAAGGRAMAVHVNVADETSVLAMAEAVNEHFGRIDILVNNAGFGLHTTLLDKNDIDLHAKALDVMCLAVLILGGAAARAMRGRGHGRIINVSSTAGTICTGNYSAVKAWCTTYSQALALELTGTGVTSTALCPGWVRTEFHQRAGIKASSLPSIVWIDAETLVRGALADAEKGRFVSVPTLKWKIANLVAVHGPRSFTRWFSRKLSASRKKH